MVPATEERVTSSKQKTILRPAAQEVPEENFSQTEPNTAENVPLKDSQLIIRLLAKVLLAVEDLSKRIECRRTPAASGDVDVVTNYLPLTSTNQIEDFDKIVQDNPKVKEQFNTFVRKIGGRTARDDIQRTLRKIFANSCAELCSWKGRKKNFCIEALCITKLIKIAVMETYPSEKEMTIEEIMSDWFQFSKQRDSREKAKTTKRPDKINEI